MVVTMSRERDLWSLSLVQAGVQHVLDTLVRILTNGNAWCMRVGAFKFMGV